MIRNSPLDGRTIVVTGAARGLGLELALGLLAAGAGVTAVDLGDGALDGALAERAASAGLHGRLMRVAADVTAPPDCERVVAATVERFGRLDGLVNNAGLGMDGVNPRFASDPMPFWRLPVDDWTRVMAVNATGPFLMARAAAPRLVAQGRGRIVNVTTSYATMLLPAFSPYGPSKAAVEAATVIWAKDLAGTGVTCKALLPGGAARTRMISDLDAFDPASLLPPDVLVRPAVWLLSDASDGVTGRRVVAKEWRDGLDPAAAAALAVAPAAW
jgi:3-oxoacyl-[acyl-carrier protein] reductase